jgi:ribonucleoside-diphosphate reductase alpha chain
MAKIESLQDMRLAVKLGTEFLLAGTVYSDVPYSKVAEVRTKNRRLGLGLMGLHEWMLLKGLKYGPSEELAEYMAVYTMSGWDADRKADEWGLSRPVKTRAIAPTGSIGILAETSTGVEPLFCVAYKRRYLKGTTWQYQYVIDPTAKRLIESGVKPEDIEDAYTLAEQPERRIAFQAWLQQYVDHGISSTLNLPAWGSEFNNEDRVEDFGNMLIKHLPKLRGMTCYPDGCRSGQPLTPVKYATAIKHVGQVFVEAMDICDLTRSGSCGS